MSSSASRARRWPGAVGVGLASVGLAVLLAAGCQRSGSSDVGRHNTTDGAVAPAPGTSARLLLYCGAGLRPAASEIVRAFEQQHGVTVQCDYDGSQRLLARIKLSGLGDVYMPGDVRDVEQAAEQGLVSSYENACYFIPVILVQKGNPQRIQSLADLARPGIDVGLGNPEACAIGRVALQLFEKNGIPLDDVRQNVRFQALTVNDLGNHIKLGRLDAVIVWDAMAAYFADASDVVAIPPERNVISTVAAGVLTTSQQPDLAARLVAFIASDAGKAIFRKHDYTTELPE